MGVGQIRHGNLRTRSVLFASGILAQYHRLVNYSTDHNSAGRADTHLTAAWSCRIIQTSFGGLTAQLFFRRGGGAI